MNDQEFDLIEEVMQEPSGGHNNGRSGGVELNTLAGQLGYRVGAGFSIVWPSAGTVGAKSHRGILHPDEYVDESLLQEAVEERLGFSYADIQRIYSLKGLSPEDKELKDRIDRRILDLYMSGANMYKFAEVVGMTQITMNRAVDRAKSRYSNDLSNERIS